MGSIAKNAGQAELVDAGAVERLLISCIGVTPDARGGVIPEDTFEALGGIMARVASLLTWGAGMMAPCIGGVSH